jgi:predicted Zn-dependent protease
MVLPPAPDSNLLAENDAFWSEVMRSAAPAVQQAQNPPDLTHNSGLVGWAMKHLHVSPEANPNALLAGTYYSRSLNAFGVQMQRAGDLTRAEGLFGDALAMNSNNVVATANATFNKTLRLRSPYTFDPERITADLFGKYRSWNEILDADGPFDEPSYCFDHGNWLFNAKLFRQAALSFNRVRQLVPDNLPARLFLAQTYVMYHQPDEALDALHEPLARPMKFGLTDYNSTELKVLAAAGHFEKNENAQGATILEEEMDRHPDDETLLLASAQVFNMRGLYTNALHAIDRKLARSPNDPTWLYGKGVVCLQVGLYSNAIVALDRFLETQSNNPAALFNRAFAYFKNDQLDAARADFQQLQQSYTNSFQVAYALGEIAWRQQQTNEARRNYQIFAAQAPTNSLELPEVRQRLSQLDGK